MEGRLEDGGCGVMLLGVVDVFEETEETEDMDDEWGVVYMAMMCCVDQGRVVYSVTAVSACTRSVIGQVGLRHSRIEEYGA